MSTRNEPTGIIWHDDEQPYATYPTMPGGECLECGCACDSLYCNRCCDKLIRQSGIAREQELAACWKRIAEEREESRTRYDEVIRRSAIAREFER